jgi:signal peptidase I
VVFRAPQNVREFVVKRVIAVPGDLVATTSNGRVMISDHRIAEPYLPQPMTSGTIAPQIVPAGCYFVMGDNRRDSLDSRSWGVLPGNLIVGRARLVLWSSGGGGTVPAAFASSSSATADGRPARHRLRFLLPIAER